MFQWNVFVTLIHEDDHLGLDFLYEKNSSAGHGLRLNGKKYPTLM